MKGLLLINFILFGFFLNVEINNGQDIDLKITNIRSNKGEIMVALFNSETTFTKKAYKAEVVKAVQGEVSIVFRNISPGDYAISVFHDENSNKKIDVNLVGIPKEGFGFSNDAMGTFGPPSFEKAKITVSGNVSAALRLRYF